MTPPVDLLGPLLPALVTVLAIVGLAWRASQALAERLTRLEAGLDAIRSGLQRTDGFGGRLDQQRDRITILEERVRAMDAEVSMLRKAKHEHANRLMVLEKMGEEP